MVTVMADKQVNCAYIIIQVTFEKGHFAACPIQVYDNTYYSDNSNGYGYPRILTNQFGFLAVWYLKS